MPENARKLAGTPPKIGWFKPGFLFHILVNPMMRNSIAACMGLCKQYFLVNGIRGWQLRIFYRFHGCDGKLFPYSSNCAAIATTESLTIGTKLLVSNICRQLVGKHQKSSKNMNETTIWIDSKAPNFHFVTWSSQVKRGCTAKRSFQALRKWSRGVFCHEILVIFYGIYYRTSNVHIMRFFHGIPISVINTL